MAKQPKKKIVGVKVRMKPGQVVSKGEPTKTTMSAEKGTFKEVYTPKKVETGHKAYGKPGGGTNPEMNRLIKEAQAKKRDVTDYSSKGLHYRAGETKTVETPAKLAVKADVKPTVRKWDMEQKPVYAAKKPDKLKPRDVTLGGSDKKGNPANKYGVGTKKKVYIRKTKSFPKK